MTQPSERLKTVLAVGDTLALFPVLKDWPTEELQSLLMDVEEMNKESQAGIDKAWEAMAFDPAIFFNGPMSQQLDRVRDNRKMEIMMVMSEICSVAIHYLERRGVKVDLPEEG